MKIVKSITFLKPSLGNPRKRMLIPEQFNPKQEEGASAIPESVAIRTQANTSAQVAFALLF